MTLIDLEKRLSDMQRFFPNTWKGQAAFTCEEMEFMLLQNKDLRDWMRCADGFAWAHEHGCPRKTSGEEACNCGLDAFLSQPRKVMGGYRDTLKKIRLLANSSTDENARGNILAILGVLDGVEA
jgi:hypothetical protein